MSWILFNHWLIANTDYDSKHFLMFNFLHTQHYSTFVDSSKTCEYQEVEMYLTTFLCRLLPLVVYRKAIQSLPSWAYLFLSDGQAADKKKRTKGLFFQKTPKSWLSSLPSCLKMCVLNEKCGRKREHSDLTWVVFHKITSCIYWTDN